MSCLVTPGDLIDHFKDTKPALISQNDDKENKEGKEKGQPLHKIKQVTLAKSSNGENVACNFKLRQFWLLLRGGLSTIPQT